MLIDIKELRDSTGMTQKEFASRYGIPISTLRKWEQGESSPAPYVAALLAELVERLLEFKMYKYTSLELKDMAVDADRVFFKKNKDPEWKNLLLQSGQKRSLRCERKPHHDSRRVGRCERAESCVVSGRFV